MCLVPGDKPQLSLCNGHSDTFWEIISINNETASLDKTFSLKMHFPNKEIYEDQMCINYDYDSNTLIMGKCDADSKMGYENNKIKSYNSLDDICISKLHPDNDILGFKICDDAYKNQLWDIIPVEEEDNKEENDQPRNEEGSFGLFRIYSKFDEGKCIYPGVQPTYRSYLGDCNENVNNNIWEISLLDDGSSIPKMYNPNSLFGDQVCISYNTTRKALIMNECNEYSKFLYKDGKIILYKDESLCIGKYNSKENKLDLKNCDESLDQYWKIETVNPTEEEDNEEENYQQNFEEENYQQNFEEENYQQNFEEENYQQNS